LNFQKRIFFDESRDDRLIVARRRCGVPDNFLFLLGGICNRGKVLRACLTGKTIVRAELTRGEAQRVVLARVANAATAASKSARSFPSLGNAPMTCA